MTNHFRDYTDEVISVINSHALNLSVVESFLATEDVAIKILPLPFIIEIESAYRKIKETHGSRN